MWFLLAQAARRSAEQPSGLCEHRRNTDAREAWLELERVYGGRAQTERPVQLLVLERTLRDLQRNSAAESSDVMVKLDTVWREFHALGNVKAEEIRKAALLRGIKGALPHVFIQLTTQAGTTHDELKCCHGIINISDVRHGTSRRSGSVPIENRRHRSRHGAR